MKLICQAALFAILTTIGSEATAVYFSSYIYEMMSNENFISKVVSNDTNTLNMYQISSYEIDKPGKGGENIIYNKNRHLIYTPLQLKIEPNSNDFFKILYIGPKDNRERYYRVVFQETPLVALKNNATTFFPKVSLSTILIVRPRLQNFKYRLDEENGVIENTGNTFFRVIIHRGCGGKDEDANQFYILPGEKYQDESVRMENKKFIIVNKKYIPLGNKCFK